MKARARILGIDFGLKRIGIAIGSKHSGCAQPLACIHSNKRGPNWHKIADIIAEWSPTKIVIGLPLSIDGFESPMSTHARKFANNLAQRCSIEIKFMDERFTSVAADNIIREATAVGKRVKPKSSGLRDSIAAQLIVESYLRSTPAQISEQEEYRYAGETQVDSAGDSAAKNEPEKASVALTCDAEAIKT